jgi:hypothetical protein
MDPRFTTSVHTALDGGAAGFSLLNPIDTATTGTALPRKNNLATALLELECRRRDVHASLVSNRCATFQAAQMVKTRKITTRQSTAAA